MSPERLLKYFEQISEAPDAVPRLRRFILNLAVRGKLVEQDPADEPASELLKRIEAKKAILAKAGNNRKQKPSRTNETNPPSELPKGWKWCRLGRVINLISGQHLQPNEYSEDSQQGIPYITGPADFGQNGLVISRYALIKKATSQEGQILLTVKGSGVGKTAICNLTQVAISRQLMAMNAIEWNQHFLLHITNSLAADLKEKSRSLIPGIAREDVEHFTFGMPPLLEQQRIVTKVDELMAVCDGLEAAQQKRERRRDRLVAATLNGLNNGDGGSEARNRSEFEESARFYFNHLPRLTTRPEHVQQLRQTILNLAVRGKLVPQDSNDEPADSLISCIDAERKRRASAGSPVNTQALADSEDGGFPIPQSWRWGRLGFITNVLMGQSPPGETYNTQGEGIPLINGPVEFSNGPFGTTVLNQYTTAPTKLCKKGDLLLCVRGSTTGRTNIASFDACIGRGVAALQPLYTDQFVRLFVWLWRDKIIEMGRGIAFPSISRQQIEDLPVPIPPLAEQNRIVAKVNELMGLSGRLESRLAANAITRLQLLEAALSEAIAP